MSSPQPVAQFRAMVRAAHAVAFTLHRDVAVTLEDAIIISRPHSNEMSIVLDMHMIQAYKAHLSVCLLCEHGMIEDAATITRRLLELSIQTVYIAAEDDPKVCQRRAGSYLAFLWRKFPRRFRENFPANAKARWSGYARKYGRYVRKNAKSWGPNWKQMFTAIDSEKLYNTDYALLSSIAHGSPDEQVLTYSASTVRIHAHHHVSALLVFASKYYLAVAEQWNHEFKLVEQVNLDRMAGAVVKWTPND
jgi:hypothetical protein